ncbi:hypothetical protein [Caballeronia choica]|uniref:hypothetical protein n=1 Tax=Caballeronia choica TaxID=326476 RepID=UPI000F7445EC|nr:hypothetical protein [Caballeronia choica]
MLGLTDAIAGRLDGVSGAFIGNTIENPAGVIAGTLAGVTGAFYGVAYANYSAVITGALDGISGRMLGAVVNVGVPKPIRCLVSGRIARSINPGRGEVRSCSARGPNRSNQT